MSETGTIKFVAERSIPQLDSFEHLRDLNDYRTKIRRLGLLGVDENGIGFGNISLRNGGTSEFYITGSNTGHKDELTLDDCAKVTRWLFAKNWLCFEGAKTPSSESLTHAAIYEARPRVGAILHGHDSKLWRFLLSHSPATPAEVEYGTPEMAQAVGQLLRTSEPSSAFAMAGHEAGVIVFGDDLADVYNSLERILKTVSS